VSDQGVRIQKALADAAVASRRAAEALVEAGRVTVNGQRAVVGQRVRVHVDAIEVDGRPIGERPQAVHLALHKPAGVTSTVSDRHAARTVVDLVPSGVARRAGRLYPVGRLDRESEGLILLTNDGDWAQRISHPSHGVEREYALGLVRAGREQARTLAQVSRSTRAWAGPLEPIRRTSRRDAMRWWERLIAHPGCTGIGSS